MSTLDADVLLVTRDLELNETVRRHRPQDLSLRCVSPQELPPQPVAVGELWLDLDLQPPPSISGGTRRVYFYTHRGQTDQQLPAGLFIRKPGPPAVFTVLWGGVTPRTQSAAASFAASESLPAWIIDYLDLRLKPLCDKLVNKLPARLGYREGSLYLHDPDRQLLTLCGSTQRRTVEFALPMDATDQPIVDAARSARILTPSRRPEADHDAPPPDSLIAPLTFEDTLVGVVSLTTRDPDTTASSGHTLEAIFAFLGRALHFAQAHAHSQTEARVDCLTGLFNQRWMMEALTSEIQRAERYNTPLAILMIDLDDLKRVNDCNGHAAGDCLLQHVATRIAGVLRQVDGAARVGGDEFIVILPGTDLRGAQMVARRLLESFREDVALFRDVQLQATAAVGVAEWRRGSDAKRLVELADEAMYAAKQRGPNSLACQTPPQPKSIRLGPSLPSAPPTSLPTRAAPGRHARPGEARPAEDNAPATHEPVTGEGRRPRSSD